MAEIHALQSVLHAHIGKIALCVATALCLSNHTQLHMLEALSNVNVHASASHALIMIEGLPWCLSCLWSHMMPHNMMLCLLHVVVMLELLTVVMLANCGSTC